MAKTRKVPVRVFCEDTSQLLKSIRSHKEHGKIRVRFRKRGHSRDN